jgi:hypothetical protein
MTKPDYFAKKDSTNGPELLPGEEKYQSQTGVNWCEKRTTFKNGTVLLSTHHLFWYNPSVPTQDAFKIPLFYLENTDFSVSPSP